MASGRAEEQPPALPVKQHRRSSAESDCTVLSPVGLQHQNYAYNDVFPESTDCHADQCPIHQRYDPSRHQLRFFSDDIPPPVPKKRLARTLSHPGMNVPPLSPLCPFSPLQRQPQNFDNPLYMMAPIPATYFHEETEEIEEARRGSISSLSFSQLSFDTPDEHLPFLFSSFVDQRVVSQGIQHRHLLFLRSMAQSMEAGSLLQGEASGRDVSSYQPQDFLLCEGSKPKQVGDTIYYSLHSPKFPGRQLGLRVHKQTDASAHTKQQPPHVNVQEVIALFQPSKNNTSSLQTEDPRAASSAKPPGGSSTESVNTRVATVQVFLEKGHTVSVERDLPQATLEDFVEDSRLLQSSECVDYDRQVCVVLLQILMGSHHLYHNNAAAAELRLQEILLVWPSREKDKGDKMEMEWEMTEERCRIQMLWRTHGSPRVVLTPQSSALSLPQPLTAIKLQIAALIQFCLHPQESQASPGSTLSSYRAGLLHVSSLLQSDSGPQMSDIAAMLQVLLWGPRVPLFSHRGSTNPAVHNWLTIKRALLVMKLAERGLIQDQSALDWEDCMCLQYLAFTDSETVVSVTGQLWRSDRNLQSICK